MSESHKYFFSLDGLVITFPNDFGYKSMTSFLALSLFAGMFSNREELLQGLVAVSNLDESIAAFEEDDIFSIYIVKEKRTEKGVRYDEVTDGLIFKSRFKYMSGQCVYEFLLNNRYKYTIMAEFFSEYLEDFRRLEAHFRNQVSSLENQKRKAKSAAEAKSLEKTLVSKSNSLANFVRYTSNVEHILTLIRILSVDGLYADRKIEEEFVSRLSHFVQGEAFYFHGKKKTNNYRGLVKMVGKMCDLLERYPGLMAPHVSNDLAKERYRMLRYFKEAVSNKKKNAENRTDHEKQIEHREDYDPDDYMFLEDEDFTNLLRADSKKEHVESVSYDIDTLNKQKKRREL